MSLLLLFLSVGGPGPEPEPEPEEVSLGRHDLGGGPGGGRRAERIRRKRIEPSLAAVRMLGLEDTGPVRPKPKPVEQVARVAQEPEPEKAPDLTLQNALATAMNAEVQRKVEAVRAEMRRREEEEAAFAEMDLDLLMLVSEW